MYYLFEVWAERLVEAFVNEAGKGKFEELEAAKDESDLRLSFYRLGIAYLSLVTRPDIIAMTRLIIGEAARQPELCRIFYGNGARRTLLSLGVVMQILIARGLLRQADPYQTGLYFKSLCEAGLLERQLWGLDQVPDVQTLHTTVAGAIDVFLPAYAASTPPDTWAKSGPAQPR